MESIDRSSKDAVKEIIRRSRLLPVSYKLTHPSKETSSCPVCHYHGPFVDDFSETGPRKHAKCPSCNAFERHRLQFVVMSSLADKYDFSSMALLHFAPEIFFRRSFEERFGHFSTADLLQPHVDHNVDLTDLTFSNETYDCVTEDYPAEYQLYIYEDRSPWPIETMPLRPTIQGDRHVDIVPVCYVKK